MKNKYKTLLKVHVKGKRSVQFEQAWLCHTEEYFTEPSSSQSDANSNMETSLLSLWAALVDSIQSKPTIQDQRIVVSTLAYFIYDLKVEKVKDYKESFASAVSVNDGPNLPDVEYIPKIKLNESTVNLYRYGGFSLHSLLKKYGRLQQASKQVDQQQSPISEVSVCNGVLKQPGIQDSIKLPAAIHYLNQGGLFLMSSHMLPYLKVIVESVSSLINEDKCQQLGVHMIETVCEELEGDAELFGTFVKCIEEAHVNVELPSMIPKLHKELLKKIFHARVNEFMTASVEIELEKSAKAVPVEQSLRDKLKTFSGLKTG